MRFYDSCQSRWIVTRIQTRAVGGADFLFQMDKSLSAPALLRNILKTVQEFSPGEQGDDLTLLLLKGRTAGLAD